MNIRFIFLVLMTSLLFNVARAQNKTVYISVTIDSSIIESLDAKELIVKIHNPVKALNNEEELLSVPIPKSGQSELRIKNSTQYTYLSFWTRKGDLLFGGKMEMVPIKYPHRMEWRNNEEVYLFDSTDSVSVNILKGGVFKFEGKGANKLNYQSQMFNLRIPRKIIDDRKYNLFSGKNENNFLEFSDSILKLEQELLLSLLKTYKGKFSDEIYDILYLNTFCYPEYQFGGDLFQLAAMQQTKSVVQEHYKKYLQSPMSSKYDINTSLMPYYYTKLIFQKELNFVNLSGKDQIYGDPESISDVYSHIKSKYNGAIRDHLMLLFIKHLTEFFSNQGKLIIDDAISVVGNREHKMALQKWKNNLVDAYPFELQDVYGKVHKLSDYRGKVVVMDFWFTGCVSCVYLNQSMHQIIKNYKNNKDLVFITISQDVQKDMWIKSISSGKYTSPETINLYTNGQGRSHPIMAYYNILSAPRQLIIGKDSKMVNSSPPRPDLGEEGKNAKAFMQIIDDALQLNTNNR